MPLLFPLNEILMIGSQSINLRTHTRFATRESFYQHHLYMLFFSLYFSSTFTCTAHLWLLLSFFILACNILPVFLLSGLSSVVIRGLFIDNVRTLVSSYFCIRKFKKFQSNEWCFFRPQRKYSIKVVIGIRSNWIYRENSNDAGM